MQRLPDAVCDIHITKQGVKSNIAFTLNPCKIAPDRDFWEVQRKSSALKLIAASIIDGAKRKQRRQKSRQPKNKADGFIIKNNK